MSILIKDMEMPISCPDCPLSLNMFFCRARECRPITARNGIELTDNAIQVSRPDWCPLAEIPKEHGDLIDVEEKFKGWKIKAINKLYDEDFQEEH